MIYWIRGAFEGGKRESRGMTVTHGCYDGAGRFEGRFLMDIVKWDGSLGKCQDYLY